MELSLAAGKGETELNSKLREELEELWRSKTRQTFGKQANSLHSFDYYFISPDRMATPLSTFTQVCLLHRYLCVLHYSSLKEFSSSAGHIYSKWQHIGTWAREMPMMWKQYWQCIIPLIQGPALSRSGATSTTPWSTTF